MNSPQSKLKKIFVLAALILFFLSCDSDKDVIIPFTPIDIVITLNNYPDLNPVVTAKHSEDMGYNYLGYLNHGIIVVHSLDGYIVFDATCTYDIEAQEHVEVTEISSGIAECPICKSKFNLLDGSSFSFNDSIPLAEYPLKRYNTIYNSNTNTLRVKN